MKNSAPNLRSVGFLALAALLLMTSTAQALPEGMVMKDYISGLKFPVTVAAAGEGDILVAEKFGTIRLVRDDKLVKKPIASVDVTAQNEAGLIGITPMPDYAESGEFLVLYTPEDPLDKMFVSLLKLEGERAQMVEERWIELPSRPNTDRHFGGNLRFGPDGMLYITQGDLRDKATAQDVSTTPGSVLRYNADGSVPADNPFGAENPVFAYGLRNAFDLDFDPDGRLYVNVNGEDSTDEINFIEAGNNYGWPLIQGHCDNFPVHEPCQDADLFADPAFEFRTTIGPTGMSIYKGAMFPELVGHVLMGGWHSSVIHRLAPAPQGSPLAEGALVQLEPLYRAAGDLGLTDIEEAPDGALLVLFAGPNGGEIKRIVAGTGGKPDPGEPDPDKSDDSGADDGCGCAATGASLPASVVWFVLVVGAGLSRRRRMRG